MKTDEAQAGQRSSAKPRGLGRSFTRIGQWCLLLSCLLSLHS